MKRNIFGIILTLFALTTTIPTYADTTAIEEVIEAAELTPEEIECVEQLTLVSEIKEVETPTYVDLGIFKLTTYCSCYSCNYLYGGYPTAYDTDYVEGRTIAVVPKVIPLDSIVEIDISGEGWHQYRAEDTGGTIKGN